MTLAVELCRLAARGAASVSFATTKQVDFGLTDPAGGDVWDAGQGERYSSPGPTVTVAAASCLVWSSTWDGRDEHGFVVPPGTYTIGYGFETTSGPFGGFTSGDTLTVS